MLIKKIFILIFGLIALNSISQNNKNIISGRINVPLIVDELKIEDHFLDNRRDSNIKRENIHFDIYTDLRNIPIFFFQNGKSFKGSFQDNLYNLITKLEISGEVNHETNLGSITISQKQTKNAKSGVCDYNYEYSYTYEYKNLKVRKQLPIGSKHKNATTMFFFTPNKNTQLKISNFKYIEDTKCPKRNYSKELVKKAINSTVLEQKLSSSWAYFRFNVNWDGRDFKEILKESTTVTQIRGEDQNWTPPSSAFLSKNSQSEPNSVAFYCDYNNLDENLKNSIKNSLNLNQIPLENNAAFTVLPRGDYINKYLFEKELSNSGLVKEETIIKNKLMKEEIAVIIKPDINKKVITCNIISKSKNIEIKSENYIPSETESYINLFFTNYIVNELNNQFKN